jgi:hypothetical protein
MPNFNSGLPAATYVAALKAEAAIPNLPKERRAAILAELEALGGVSTADQNRSGIETAGVAPADAAQGRHADSAPVAPVVDGH